MISEEEPKVALADKLAWEGKFREAFNSNGKPRKFPYGWVRKAVRELWVAKHSYENRKERNAAKRARRGGR